MPLLVTDLAGNLETFGGASFVDIEENIASLAMSSLETPWNPFGHSPGVALRHLAAIGGIPGAVAVAGIAAFGEPTVQPKARAVLQRLTDDGIEVPEWVHDLGTAELIDAAMICDQWDEHMSVVVDYRRPDGTVQEIRTAFHPHAWGVAHGFAARTAAASGNHDVPEGRRAIDISLAEARALLDHGLAEFDRASVRRAETAGEFDDDPDWSEEDDDRCLRPLIGRLVRLLPAVGQFVADRTLGEDASDIGDMVMTAALFANSCWNDDVFRWNPPRVKMFLEQWVTNFGFESGGNHMESSDYREAVEHGFEPSDGWLTALDAAFPRWLRMAAEQRNHSGELLEANLAAARDSLRERG